MGKHTGLLGLTHQETYQQAIKAHWCVLWGKTPKVTWQPRQWKYKFPGTMKDSLEEADPRGHLLIHVLVRARKDSPRCLWPPDMKNKGRKVRKPARNEVSSQWRSKLGSRHLLSGIMKAKRITDLWTGPLENNAPRQPWLALCRLVITLWNGSCCSGFCTRTTVLLHCHSCRIWLASSSISL